MSIYRGAGGAGDAVNDASSEATLVAQLAAEAQEDADAAQASATAAAGSASAASTSASNAATSATNSANSATAAANSAASIVGDVAAAEAAQAAAVAAQTAAELAETNAETAQTAAELAETNAETAAATATTQAGIATTQASNASTSASAALASQLAAEAAFDAFDDIYLGAKASNPTVDNDGNALTTGDQYFNTVSNELRVWNGSSWQAASVIGGTVTSLNVTGSATFTSISDSGNLTFTGTGNRITGDFSNATLTSRVAFQSSTTNGITSVGAIPNGTAVSANFRVYGGSDTNNTSIGQLLQNGSSETQLRSDISGTGTYASLAMFTGGSERLRIDTGGNVGVGTSSPANKLDVVGNGVRNVARASTTAGDVLVEAQASDYWSTPTYTGTHIRQHGSTATGTTSGLSNAGLGILGFQNATAGLIYTNGGTPLVFATTSAERMRLDASGNLGIGTSSPAYKLDVNGLTRFRFVSGTGAGTWLDTAGNAQRYFIGTDAVSESWRIFDSVAGTQRILLDSSGNVGIGGTPFDRLDVHGGGATIRGNILSTGASISLTNASNSYAPIGISNGTAQIAMTSNGAATELRTITNHPQVFMTNNTERMRIDSAGNVGIGLSNPSSYGILATSGNINNLATALGTADAATVSILNNSVGGLGIRASLSMSIAGIGKSVIAGYYAAFNGSNDIGTGLQFGTQTNAAGGVVERMRIDSAGNVGIGTNNPSGGGGGTTVNIAGSTAATFRLSTSTSTGDLFCSGADLFIQQTSATGALILRTGSSASERMRIDSAGNVGIGTSSPAKKLHVSVSGTSQLRLSESTNAFYVDIGRNDSDGMIQFVANQGLGYKWFNASNEVLRIDSSGNVGIGTNSPSSKLTVTQATAGATAFLVNGVAAKLTFDYLGGGQSYLDSAQLNFRKFDATTCGYFETATNTHLNLTSSSGYALLSLNTASGNTSYLDFASANTATARIYGSASNGMVFATGSSNTERMRITSTGQLRTTVTGTTMMDEYGCRAWVNFNGTGTVAIRASGNVSSITDNGTGDYTVNFTTAMPDANYSVVGAMGDAGSVATNTSAAIRPKTYATGSIRFVNCIGTAAAVDFDYENIAIFR